MPRRLFKLVLILAGFAIVATLCFVALKTNREPPLVPMPNPNGYDDFVKAAGMLTGNPAYDTMSQTELAVAVAANREALKLVRAGFAHECRVVLDYSPTGQKSLDSLASFKREAFALRAEGRLAEMEGRTNDAARIYLDGVRFAQEVCRGGVIIHKLVGVACETIAAQRLAALTGSLDAQQCREMARDLEAIDAKEEPPETVLLEEKNWSRRMFGWKGELQALIADKLMRPVRTNLLKKARGATLSRRQMIVGFAARVYELEKGKRPEKIADLVPGYLKAIPKDPTTGTNLSLGR